MSTPIQRLYEAGTAPWVDNIRRGWLKDGTFSKLIDTGIVGVTTNPTIFQKAFSDTDDYDEGLRALAQRGVTSGEEAFFTLAIEDVQGAADQLRDVYERTDGLDGRVSFELPPGIANDTEASTQMAADLHRRIDRPNIYIKIPGTTAGPKAIEDSIAAGISVNVTLLFAVERYEEIASAWIDGLERRVAAGEPVDRLASVASFFFSRVDTKVDARLEELGRGDLQGMAAVANAKLAYRSFQRLFSGPRWEALAAKGAHVQRPLWASTSTKNPAYPDTLYVDTLIGPDTVNTMPEATIDATRDHGVASRSIDKKVDVAEAHMKELASVGVDLDAILVHELVDEGVDAFANSFDSLIATIDEKARALAPARA